MAHRRIIGTQMVLACRRHPELPQHWLVKLRSMESASLPQWVTMSEAEYARKVCPVMLLDDVVGGMSAPSSDPAYAWSGSITV